MSVTATRLMAAANKGPASYQAKVLADNPISFWPLNEDAGAVAQDYGSLGNHAQYVDMDVIPDGTNGSHAARLVIGSQLGFDTGNDVTFKGNVIIPDREGYSPATDGTMSIEVLAVLDSTGPIVFKGVGGSYEWGLQFMASKIQFNIFTAAGVNILEAASAGDAFYVGLPAHFVVTINTATPRVEVWMNGVSVAVDTVSDGGAMANSANPINVGRRNDTNGMVNGAIACLAIYDYVLTSTQIQAHHAALTAPPIVASDTFDRANSAVSLGNADTGQAWVNQYGTWGIIDNTAYVAVEGVTHHNSVVMDVGLSNVSVEVTFPTFSLNCGLLFRGVDDANHLMVVIEDTGWLKIFKRVAGVFTELAFMEDYAFASGDTLKVVAIGPSIEAFKNGVSLGCIFDSTFITATKVGLRAYNTGTVRFNNFKVRSIPAPSDPTVTALDQFNRADSAVTLGTAATGQAWQAASGTWGILTNRAYNVSGTGGGTAVVEAGSSDMTVQARINTYGNGNGLVARFSNMSNHYQGYVQGTECGIYKVVAGVTTAVGAAPVATTTASDDILTFSVIGSQLTLLKNGVVIVARTDSSLTTGTKGGIRGDTNSNKFDDFSIRAETAFNPLFFPGLNVWLDSSDSATITDAGAGAVSAWADKSGKGHSLQQVTSGSRPTTGTRTLNGKNVLDFNGSNSFLVSTANIDTAASDKLTVFVVVQMDTASMQSAFVEFGPSTFSTTGRGGLIYTEGGGMRGFITPNAIQQMATTSALGGSGVPYVVTTTADFSKAGSQLVKVWRNADGTVSYVLDGVLGAATDMVSDVMYIGMRGGVSLPHDGIIAEIVVYNSVLNTKDRETVRDYLMSKWGIERFDPVDLPNLKLWLDPSDLSSISHSAGSVSQINDKSGSGNNFVQANSGRQPITGTVTLNGLNVLDFDGSNDFMAGPLLTSAIDNISMYCVCKPDAAPSSAGTLALHNGQGGSNGYGPALATFPSAAKVGYLRGGVAWHDGLTAPPSSGGHLLTLIRSSGTWQMRLNRAAEVGGTLAPNTPTTESRLGNHEEVAGGYLNGGIAEVLFYATGHSNADRDTVETYLRNKWGTL